jgi:hypothetical protein
LKKIESIGRREIGIDRRHPYSNAMESLLQHLPSGLPFVLQLGTRPELHGTFFKPRDSSILWAHTSDMPEPKYFLFVAKQYLKGEEIPATIYDHVFLGRGRIPLTALLSWPVSRIQSFDGTVKNLITSGYSSFSTSTTESNATAYTNTNTNSVDAKELVRRFRAKNDELTARLVLLREAAALKEDSRQKETEVQSLLRFLSE